jgi:hypothetical protein
MKNGSKVTFIFSLLVLLGHLCAGQENTPAPAPDEGMEIFLLSIMTIFFAVLAGAAVAGIVLGMVILCGITVLIGLGIISTSVMIGLYRRSIASGFKSFLVISFIIACTFAAITGLYLLNHYLEWGYSLLFIGGIGLGAGTLSGALIGMLAFKLMGFFRKLIMEQFRLHA